MPLTTQKSNKHSILRQLMGELKQYPDQTTTSLLKKHDIISTDSAFSIPKERGIDMIFEGERFFLYRSSREDKDLYEALKHHNIPVCPRINIDEVEEFSAISLPFDAVSMARMPYREQDFSHGAYLGACEIMVQLGKFIKRIRTSTQLTPVDLTLDAFILASSEKELIRLTPPLVLNSPPPISELQEKLKKSLAAIDPYSAHERHVQIFINNYL